MYDAFYSGANLVYYPKHKGWMRTFLSYDFVRDSAFFELPNGNTGFMAMSYFLQNPYGRGPCGSCEHEMLVVYRLNGSRVERYFDLDVNMGNIEVWWPDDWTIPEYVIPNFETLKWDAEAKVFRMEMWDEWEGNPYIMAFTWDDKDLPYVAEFRRSKEGKE